MKLYLQTKHPSTPWSTPREFASVDAMAPILATLRAYNGKKPLANRVKTRIHRYKVSRAKGAGRPRKEPAHGI